MMMRKSLTTIILLCITFFTYAQEVSISGNKFYVGQNEIWFNGINTPWDLFDDFGRSDFDTTWWAEEFALYKENNINLARVWIHGSGEVSPDIDSTGYVSGASDLFWEHMDYLVKVATENEVYVMPALLSFDITKNTYTIYEYWRAWLQSESNIQSYIDNVLIPMVERYDDEPYLFAWEICNEPEWMFENDEHGPQSFDDVQRMHAMLAAAVHENCSKPVTTGSAAPKWNSPIYDSWGDNEGNMFSDSALAAAADNENAYLDFYQYHWYPWQTEWMDSPFTKTTEEYEVDDRPVIVGECEGNDVSDEYIDITVTEMYESAYNNGFDGVCAWKTPQNDGYGTFENIAVATNAFYENHPLLVYPDGSDPVDVESVDISETEIEIQIRDSYELTVSVLPEDASDKRMKWTTNDSEIATVNNGIVTGVAPGVATITATSNVGGYIDTCVVTVTERHAICDDPVDTLLPLSLDGAGVYCYAVSGTIDNINSWGLDYLEINGEDYANVYSSEMPSTIDGKYYIYYEATEDWAHLEIAGTSSDVDYYDLTVTASEGGSVDPESGNYASGTTVTITATADDGYKFVSWTGDTTGTSETIDVIMNADKSLTATFVESDDSVYYTLTVLTEGEGTVEVTPSEDSYLEGTSVTLIATPASGYVFDSWSGDASSTTDTLTITMDANMSVTANFADTSSSSSSCDYETPLSTALPSINSSYSYVHVLGSDGPDLSNFSNLTINWDLDNDGLYQLSMSTNDGEPDWWNDLLDYQTNTFSETQPAITFSSTNITGLDASYYVALDDDNFVMDEQSGAYTLYFSNSSVAPCTKSAQGLSSFAQNSEIKVYPNPANNNLYLYGIENINKIAIHSVLGQKILDQDLFGQSEIVLSVDEFETGSYIISFHNNDGSRHTELLLVE